MVAIQPKSRQLLGVNQQAYQALKSSMSLNLRRQLLIAVCDDVRMQSLLAAQLEKDLAQAPTGALGLECLTFDAEEGNLPQQVAQWVRQTMLSKGTLPAVQMLGIEQMIHQPAIAQNYFLRSLEKIEALLPRLDTSLLIWLPWPWLGTIQQSAPTFWNWRSGVFEFVSDPTPTSASQDPQHQDPQHSDFPLALAASANESQAANSKGEQPSATQTEPTRLNGPVYQNGSAKQYKAADSELLLPVAEQHLAGGLYGENASNGSGNIPGNSSGNHSAEGPLDMPEDVPEKISEDFTYDFELETLLEEPAGAESDPSEADDYSFAMQVSEITQDIHIGEVPPELLDDDIDDNELLLELLDDEFEDGPHGEDSPHSNALESSSEDDDLEDGDSEDGGLEAHFFSGDVLQNIFSLGGLRSVVMQGVNVAPSATQANLQADLQAAPIAAEGSAEVDADDLTVDESEFASLDWDDFVDSSNGADSAAEPSADASDALMRELVELVRNEPVQGEPVRSEPVQSEPVRSVPVEDERIQVHPIDLELLRPELLQPEQPIAPAVTPPQAESSETNPEANLEAKSEPAVDEDSIQQAASYFAIGLSYRNRIEAGERSLDVIEPAIAAYESGLSLLIEPHLDWVTGLNDLGTLYWLKAQQQTDHQQAIDSMNRSISLYQEALEKGQAALGNYALESQPDIIGQLYSNMGAVYTVLATFEEPLEHLKKAVETYNRAMPLASLEHNPEEYATLQNSLGSVFWKLSHYDSAAAYLHHAIAAYNEALLGYRPDQKPLDYAAVQNNLGITYWSLAKYERPEFLLKHAIAAYRDALNYRTPKVDPAACAISYNNLALAYWDLSKHTQGDIVQKSRYQKNAITAFEAALNINKTSGTLNAMDSAAIYHCLGDVHAQTIETAPSLVEVGESLQKSLYSYIKAVEDLPMDSPAYPGRFAAVVANVKLHYDKLGIEGQQSALNRVPPSLLPQVMMAL